MKTESNHGASQGQVSQSHSAESSERPECHKSNGDKGGRSSEDSIRILHLEDNFRDARLVVRTLGRGDLSCQITVVADREAYLAAVNEGNARWDVILADYTLPSFDGMSALKLAGEKCADVPFIFVSGAVGEELAIETLKSGAADYVLKDRLARLPVAVERALKERLAARQRKQAEALLNLRTKALESAANGVIVTDRNGTIVWANPACTRLTGYGSDELLGSTPRILKSGRMTGDFYRDLWTTIAQGKVWQGELTNRRKDGTLYVEEMTITPVRDFTGEIASFIAIKQDISERRRQEDALRASLHEKEILLKEVHHRVKNNLQVISSLLELGSGGSQNGGFVEILRESQTRIRTMALVHAKLYQSKDFARIDFGEYVRSLVADLSHSYQVDPESVSFSLDLGQVFLSVDLAIPCGLIMNELISNSLKHAFPTIRTGLAPKGSQLEPSRPAVDRDARIRGSHDTPRTGGVVSIALVPIGNTRVRLVVTDNGTGYPDSVDLNHPKSLGLQLVKALTAQVGGNIEIRSSRGGAECQIEFSAR